MMVIIKKLIFSGIGKKVIVMITVKNVKRAMILFDKSTKYLDKMEDKGYIKGSWNSGKKFRMIKKINSKLISMMQ